VLAGAAVTVAVAAGLYLEATRVDLGAAIRQCSEGCRPGWKARAGRPGAPEHELTDSAIAALCDCTCENGFRSLTAAQIDRMSKMRAGEDLRDDEKGAFDDALRACFPALTK